MKAYDELAAWWPLFSPPEDYAEEAALYSHQLLHGADGPVRTVLELGSGGGNNASHMKQRFTLTLVEPSDGMRRVSETLNPDCEHLPGDMRTVRLGRTFDAVFVHDAVAYMTTESDLQSAIATAFVHTRPGGVALFAPDYLRETFRPGSDHGGEDGPDRALRYLEWVWDPDPNDSTYVADYVFVLRDSSGHVRVEHDRHIEGVFPKATWIALLSQAGFVPRVVTLEHSELEPGSYQVFVAQRPAVR